VVYVFSPRYETNYLIVVPVTDLEIFMGCSELLFEGVIFKK